MRRARRWPWTALALAVYLGACGGVHAWAGGAGAAGSTCTAFPCTFDGVRVIEQARPMECAAVRERAFEGRGPTMGAALAQLAQRAKEKGADTVVIDVLYRRLPGDTRIARGHAYRCGP